MSLESFRIDSTLLSTSTAIYADGTVTMAPCPVCIFTAELKFADPTIDLLGPLAIVVTIKPETINNNYNKNMNYTTWPCAQNC